MDRPVPPPGQVLTGAVRLIVVQPCEWASLLLPALLLRLALPLRRRHFLEFFLDHGSGHGLRGAFEFALLLVAALGGKRRSRGHLLGFRLRVHGKLLSLMS